MCEFLNEIILMVRNVLVSSDGLWDENVHSCDTFQEEPEDNFFENFASLKSVFKTSNIRLD